ncbi:MAG: sulfatase-like hydrolase/transferase [Mesorhizobium sp.]
MAKRNVVLFLTDDHGQWALGSSGNREVQSPNLDYLARRGTVMENAFTPTPVCSPARACLLTGRTASQHGLHDYLDNQPEFFERDWMKEEITLPQLLQEAGYFTGIVGKWHLGNDAKPQRGFDRWNPLAGDYPIDAVGPARYSINGRLETIAGSKASVITDQAADFIRARDRTKPFFLLVGHVQTYSPWTGQPLRLIDRYRDSGFFDVPSDETFPFGVQNFGITGPD